MISDKQVLETLQKLGSRLRRARIDRGDTMEKFAVRLGVSVPTIRALEKGSPVATLGLFAHALSVLSRLYELDSLLPPPKLSFDNLAELSKPPRKRAPRMDRKR